MPRLLQFIAILMCLLASQPSRAFSLLGPVAPAAGAEAWQTTGLGYNPLGNDVGAPKNLGEEYRWNVPVITYGFDKSFVDYFGNEGVAAVDRAFAILNSLPDLTTLNTNLLEFPLTDATTGATTSFRDARRVNLRAEADELVDLKSMALGMVVEELGLASPERWTWALRQRAVVANGTATQYLVINRNFDPVSFAPSKYVNGNRYTYDIEEFPAPVQYADAIESVVDPEQRIHSFSSVANIVGGDQFTLLPGIYYTYLTRDDIGGLRYLYNATNVNWETFPAGTQMFTVDQTGGFLSLTNQDLTLLSLRSLVSSPQLLQSFYPGLVINQATPNLSTVVSNVPVVVTQTVSLLFQTNFDAPVIVSNIDLATFSSVTLTSAPANLTANLQAAFPGVPNLDQLVILSTNFSTTNFVTPVSVVVTNLPKQPWNDPFTTNFVQRTNYVTNLGIAFHYTFRNVLTNYSSPSSTFERIITGVQKEPWSDALNPIYKTSISFFTSTAIPSGAITIIPTNLLGYVFSGPTITNVGAVTNFFFSTNAIDLTSGTIRTVSQTDLRLVTNVQYFAFPIELLANPLVTNIFVTNAFVTTNIVTYNYGFANVITNYAGPNTPAVITEYQIIPDPNNPAFNQTNVILVQQTTLQVPSGGFIIDTNQTGFQFTGLSNVTVIPTTNIVFDITDPATGIRTVQQEVYNFTNTTYLVFPFVLTNPPSQLLRPGVSKLRFQKLENPGGFAGGFVFTNRFIASFFTNGVLTNAVFVNTNVNQPDILFRARDLGTAANGVPPIFVSRNASFQNNAALNTVTAGEPTPLGGPGQINPPIFIDFSKIGFSLVNQFPGFVTEASSLNSGFQLFFWGSFDGSTNAPIVYPKDITLEDIESRTAGGAAQ